MKDKNGDTVLSFEHLPKAAKVGFTLPSSFLKAVREKA